MKRLLPVSLVLALAAVPVLADAPPAVDPDFQVSQVSENFQIGSGVAQDTAGDFVAVWTDSSQIPNDTVKARLFNASGVPKTGEIAVAPEGFSPRVAMTPLGDFVVVWELNGQIYLRHFDRRGEAPVRTFDPLPFGPKSSPDVAVDPAGNAYVVWAESYFNGATIMLQRYGPDGLAVGPPEQIDQVSQPASSYARDFPHIAADPDGSLLVSWDDSRENGGHHVDVWARRFDGPSGTWSPEARVNASQTGDQEGSAPILYPDGTGAVVFNDFKAQQVLARRIDATGAPAGDPVKLGDLGGVSFTAPAAAAGSDGTALVAWEKGDNLVHARFFDRSWSPLGEELTPSSVTTDLELYPAVSAGGLGNFAAVWTSYGVPPPIFDLPVPPPPGRDGSATGVFGRAFSSLTCAAGSEVLCLQDGRFQARVSWKIPATGETGTGKAVPLTGDTGAFWFFGPDNLELMVKALDGRAVNGYFWVYYGSLSNVEYTLTLTDTVTGTMKSYHNAPSQFGSQADVSAFQAPPPNTIAAESAPLKLPETAAPAAAPEVSLFAAPDCTSTPTAFCAQDRFRVEVSFVDPRSGSSGQGRAVQLTNDTGIFWFFSPSNLELMLKVLDGSGVNGHFWVFYGALSDVDYTITVTDTATGARKTYHNPSGHLASSADVDAFPSGLTAR
ncbi:MAG TPA: hypothetical protein VFR03_15170 [Thermoanaerobaculia bacterium]|nr:hypothetical protein [Thermoanaerobaculia bacterium]